MYIELIASQQLRVIAKVAQEPAQLPQSLLGAVDPPRKQATSELLGFEHSELDGVEGLLDMPEVLGAVDVDQIHAIRDFGGLGGLVQARKAALQATPSLCPR